MNRATRANVATIGAIFGFGGITHGFAETLQGNTPTGGPFIYAIAPGSSWTRWSEGGEAAFTLVPNFLVTGILAMLVGALVIIWSLGFVHRRHGSMIYLLLFVLLFLVGGGIGQVVFFIPAWAVATRIHAPLSWWRHVLPSWLAQVWPRLLVLASALIMAALYIAVFGYIPGIGDMGQVLHITLSLVGAALIGYLLAFIAGFAYDIQQSEQQGGQLIGGTA